MAVNPLKNLNKLRGRSLEEIKVRGEQALSAYGEQLGWTGGLPTDAEFIRLLDRDLFDGTRPTAEGLMESFGSWQGAQFFPSFDDRAESVGEFRRNFGENAVKQIVARAESILQGKFNLLGFSELDFGMPIDWHLEPVSGKTAPRKHWKQFDELDSSETGDKKIVWELNRHQHFFTLGAAYWLTGDERFAGAFVSQLCGWMEQNPPSEGVNWMSSLEVAFRAISWLWALHFFKTSPSLSPGIFREALKFLYVHARHIEKYLSKFYSPNTHLTGEALGLYYLGTLLPEFRQSAQWRSLGNKILLEELDRQILPDGVYFEQTTWYQRYTVDFYTHFLILSRVNGVELTLREQEKIEHKLQVALDFLMYVTRPDGTTPLVGDDDGGRMLPFGALSAINDFRSTLATCAALFFRGDYKFVAKAAAEETFWLLGSKGLDRFGEILEHEPRETSKGFPLGGYYVMRDEWTENADYLLIDGGKHGSLAGGHAHADALSFELTLSGRTLLVDPGTFSYSDRRARDYFRSTAAHNTLTLDGKSSSEPGHLFGWQTVADIRANDWISTRRLDFFEGEHNGFSRLANSGEIIHRRSFLFLKRDYCLLRDEVLTKGEHNYELNFHFAPSAAPQLTVSPEGSPLVKEPANEQAGLEIIMFGDNGAWTTFDDSVSPCYGAQITAPTVSFASRGIGRQEFFTFLLPTRKEAALPNIKEFFVNGGRAFEIENNDRLDWFIYGDEDAVVRTKFFDSDFRFTWVRFSADEQIIEEVVLISGTRFNFGKREVINYPKRLRYAQIKRAGSKLIVKTDESQFSVSIPKKRAGAHYIETKLTA